LFLYYSHFWVLFLQVPFQFYCFYFLIFSSAMASFGGIFGDCLIGNE
jgi:hypothetical protein